MTLESKTSVTTEQLEKEVIPSYLIKETIDGIPFYYKGFRQVLNKTETKSGIMADSGLQALIKSLIMGILFKNIDLSKYHIFVGETGTHVDHRSNLALDISIFDKAILTPDKITTKYIPVPPKIVIEVDVNVELANPHANIFDEFLLRKVKKLHKFGTEKIIWIFSKSKTIIVATADNKWDVIDWDNEIELMDGITFNVVQHLQKMGIKIEEDSSTDAT